MLPAHHLHHLLSRAAGRVGRLNHHLLPDQRAGLPGLPGICPGQAVTLQVDPHLRGLVRHHRDRALLRAEPAGMIARPEFQDGPPTPSTKFEMSISAIDDCICNTLIGNTRLAH